MKKLIYIFIVLFGFACSKANKSMNKENLLNVYEVKPIFKSEINNYETLGRQKLYEYFDLIKLKNEHPEFEEDITKQLEWFNKDTIINIKYNKDSKIKNIVQVGKTLKLSDSTSKIRLKFNVQTGEVIKQDSIQAIIYTKTILLDSKGIRSNTVKFIK